VIETFGDKARYPKAIRPAFSGEVRADLFGQKTVA
jgi:hypothetical protein